jgi:thioredoxin 1
MVTKITSSQEFEEKVLNNKNLVVVDFFADWCGPCKMLGPIFEKVAEEYENVDFVKVNVEEVGEVASKYNVMSIPTLIIFKDGEVKAQQMGALPETVLKNWIDENK